MRRLPWVMLAVGLWLGAAAAQDEPAKKELDRVQGTWKLLNVEADGEKQPEEFRKNGELVIKGTKYTLRIPNTTEEGTLRLDPAAKPTTVDFTIESGDDKGKTQLGIYKLDGNRLTFCVGKPGEKDRPKEFTTKAGELRSLWEFGRAEAK